MVWARANSSRSTAFWYRLSRRSTLSPSRASFSTRAARPRWANRSRAVTIRLRAVVSPMSHFFRTAATIWPGLRPSTSAVSMDSSTVSRSSCVSPLAGMVQVVETKAAGWGVPLPAGVVFGFRPVGCGRATTFPALLYVSYPTTRRPPGARRTCSRPVAARRSSCSIRPCGASRGRRIRRNGPSVSSPKTMPRRVRTRNGSGCPAAVPSTASAGCGGCSWLLRPFVSSRTRTTRMRTRQTESPHPRRPRDGCRSCCCGEARRRFRSLPHLLGLTFTVTRGRVPVPYTHFR